MTIYGGPDIVTDGLTLCLDAANNESYPGSGTNWFNLASSNYNATLINGPIYSSNNKGGIVFDGSNDTATVNIGFLLRTVGTGDFSFSIWFNSTKSTRGDLISWKSADSTYDIGIVLNGSSSSTMQLYYKIPGAGLGFYTSFSYQSNTINNVHFQRGSGFVETYLNGALRHSNSAGGDVTNHPENTVYLASNRGVLPFAGTIFSAYIYTKSLSILEINNNYNTLKGRFGL